MNVNRKAAVILGIFLLLEGTWVIFNAAADPGRFLFILGFAAGQWGTIAGWCLAAIVAAVFVRQSMRLPSVRANLVKVSNLKLLALLMAVAAGILEEAFFRRMLMNHLQLQGAGIVGQIMLSAVAFGVAHGVWGLFGRSASAAIGATVATGALGGALAVVYVVSARSVAACVVAHTIIDMLIEPGLVLAALRGEMKDAPHVAVL